MSDRYTTPPMPFAMTPQDGVALAHTIPGVRAARDIEKASGRGIFRVFGWPVVKSGPLRRFRPSITMLEFEP